MNRNVKNCQNFIEELRIFRKSKGHVRTYFVCTCAVTGNELSKTALKLLSCMSMFVVVLLNFSHVCPVTGVGSDTGQSGSSGPGLLVWIITGSVVLLLVVTILLALLWRYHQRRCVPDRQQQSASVSLNTLAVPKRDSISSDNNGSDRSDVVFPIRASDSMICRHYERVSSDYGPPVYIVQEIMPQSPTNIYYKV